MQHTVINNPHRDVLVHMGEGELYLTKCTPNSILVQSHTQTLLEFLQNFTKLWHLRHCHHTPTYCCRLP